MNPAQAWTHMMRGQAARATVVVIAVMLATLAAFVLEEYGGILHASAVYLVAVVVAASLLGTWAAAATSAASFLIYDFLFTVPRFTLQVSDPVEWLSLLLFLIVAVVIGRLAALQRDRADEAERRVRESRALVAMSHDVALATTFEEAAAAVAGRLLRDAEMQSLAIHRAGPPARIVVSVGTPPLHESAEPWVLARTPGESTTEWVRFHDGRSPIEPPSDIVTYRIPIDREDGPVGWITATRPALDPPPGRGARRLLVLAADQLLGVDRRDRLRAELMAAEVARQSDALRAAILDSVSHDLRTPIAGIRTLAGTLADAADDPEPSTVRATAAAIDGEGERLGMLVEGLLAMGRIQAGAVRPDLRPYDLGELVESTLRHHPANRGAHLVDVDVPDDLPPVLTDAVLLNVILGNVLDNAGAHTPPGARIRLRARDVDGRCLEVVVDDEGEGVPADALDHLFERFYRVRIDGEPARRGMGLGLAIAYGFTAAMGGSITASAGELGGLAIQLRLPTAPEELP